MITILGIDLSLNHTGFVELNETGDVSWFCYVTDVAAATKCLSGILLPKFKSADRQQVELDRLEWWETQIGTIMAERRPTYVGIEDYARGSMSQSEYQTGELGGIARRCAWKAGAALRLHEPMTVKMFGAGTATATGRELADKVEREFNTGFALANPPPPKRTDQKQNTIPEEDLAAAFTVARMVYVESCLRAGSLALADLAPKQVQVFNRTTKYQPINVLGRDWLMSSVMGP